MNMNLKFTLLKVILYWNCYNTVFCPIQFYPVLLSPDNADSVYFPLYAPLHATFMSSNGILKSREVLLQKDSGEATFIGVQWFKARIFQN